MIAVYLQIARKLHASTKLVDMSSAILVYGTIKESFSIQSPVITLDMSKDALIQRINYCYIPELERYYWINSITYEDGYWVISDLECDVLASAREDILNSEQYVLRNTYSYDEDLIDKSWPASAFPSFRTDRVRNYPFVNSIFDGTYVLGVIAKSGSQYGSVLYFAMTYQQMKEFNLELMGGVNWTDIDFSADGALSENFFKTLFNPYQYVVSCNWFPLRLTDMTDYPAQNISYGWWSLNSQGHWIWDNNKLFSFNFAVTRHPQIDTVGKYLMSAPYSKYTLTWTALGSIDIPPQYFRNTQMLNVDVHLDFPTGSARVHCKPGTNSMVIADVACNLCATMPVSQMGINIMQGIQDVVNGFTQASGITGTIGAIANVGIETALTATVPEVHSLGSMGAISLLFGEPQLDSVFYSVRAGDPKHEGRPLCLHTKLGALKEFTVCKEPHFVSWLTKTESEKVMQYMREGFYIE